MKFQGNVKHIERIEELITTGTKHKISKDGTSGIHSMIGDNSQSRVFCRQYLIFANGATLAVKLGFDYRSQTGDIHIRDDKAWKLAVIIPQFAIAMSKLYPIYSRQGRGQFLKAMDKLLE